MMLTLALFATIVLVNCQVPPPWPWWSPGSPACTASQVPNNCPCEYGKCTWWGDPHTTTFDGLYHGFQGWAGGRYRYVTPCRSDFQRVPFQVLSTHTNCGGPVPGFTCPQNTDIRLYTSTGAYDRTLRLSSWSSVQQYTEPGLPGGNLPDGVYSYSNGYYRIRRYLWYVEVSVFTNTLCANQYYPTPTARPDLVVRMTNWARRVEAQVNEYYKTAVCGLCGYWNDNQADDFAVSQVWNFFGFPLTLCFSFTTVNFPPYVSQYLPSHWWIINWFGWFWQDFGTNVRRLQDGTGAQPRYTEPIEGKQPEEFNYNYNNPPRGNNAVSAQQVFGICEQFSRSVDLDCQAIANEASIRCQDSNPDACFRQFCFDGCSDENCEALCDPPPEFQGNTATDNDVTTRSG